jgi:hypothetical protein
VEIEASALAGAFFTEAGLLRLFVALQQNDPMTQFAVGHEYVVQIEKTYLDDEVDWTSVRKALCNSDLLLSIKTYRI